MTSEFDVDSGLDADQHRAVTSTAQSLCVLAGAGSGKSRVLVRRVERRIADGTAMPEHIMVLTFTRKAAGELRERLARSGIDGVTAGTFHSVAFAEIRQRYLDNGKTPPVVASSPHRLIQAALEDMRIDRSIEARRLTPEISWAKSNRLDSSRYVSEVMRTKRRTPIAPPLFAKFLDAYEAQKRKRNVVDYDDLIAVMTNLLETNPKFAKSQQWRFRHFFVDEFQDLNRAQFDLLRAWLGNRDDLFVVGDPNQAIYEWNGADASFLRKIHFHFPGIEIVSLGTNYRSTSQILKAASAVLPDGKASRPDHDMGGTLVAFDGPDPTIERYLDERNEAVGIAKRIRKIHAAGRRWRDVAVLVRTNAQRRSFEAAFERFGIPFSSGAGTGWTASIALKPAMAMLNEARSADLVSAFRDIEDLASEASEADHSVFERLTDAASDALGLDRAMKVSEFLTWLDVSTKNDGPDSRNTVVVTTFHRAKGLEWPVVFLAGVDAGFVPYGGMKTNRVDEEQRLFYVATTRAREELHLSWSLERSDSRGATIECEMSPWLKSIQDAFINEAPVVPHEPAVNMADASGVERITISDVHGALTAWRSRKAKLMGVSPKTVMTDETIDLLVAESPKTAEEVARLTDFGPVRTARLAPEILEAMEASN